MVKDLFFTSNSQIEEYIAKIKAYKELFEKLPKLSHVQENLLRKSTLKSSLFSARIEGNSLELREFELSSSRTQEKREISQIYTALKYVRSLGYPLNKESMLLIHEKAMNGLVMDAGKLRNEVSSIFNEAGVAVYVSPPPQKINSLLADFFEYLNNPKDDLSRIAIAHFAFEKIHPFLDGNGRVGRILMNWHLNHLGYGFSGLISFEEYLESNRQRYYDGLGISGKDITMFVEFILETIAISSEQVLLELQNKEEETFEDMLLPRRHEILLIIREHQMVSFDQIKRRFMNVNSRTLHYDLEFLRKKKLIKKLGNTRGAVYISGFVHE